MKIRFLIPALFFLITLFSQTQKKVNVHADIRGHSCGGGFGLCSSSAISEKANSNIIIQKIDESSILFVIDKSSLNLVNQKSIIGKEFAKILAYEKFDFNQVTNIWLDESLLIKIGINPKLSTIKTGIYPMKIENDKVLVTFNLTSK